MSQAELAEALNISVSYMGAIERNPKKMFSLDLLVEMSDFFGVSIDMLLKGTDPSMDFVKEKLTAIAKELGSISAGL